MKRSVVRFCPFVRAKGREESMHDHSNAVPGSQSRAVLLESFGGPEVLKLVEVTVPQACPGQIRVRVTAAGLNPMDWFMTADADTASRFGLSLPCGFGTDYAGFIDQTGPGVREFAVGDRVFGAALSRAVADYLVVEPAGNIAAGNDVHRTPDGVDDRTAATLAIAGCTAAAALAVVNVAAGDTVLIGGAAGGVGVFAVQLARIAGARVIGTGSPTSSEYLQSIGADPVTYGDGLAQRVRAIAPGVTAAIDLHGTDTVHAARDLGVPDDRITTIAAQVEGITPANGADAVHAIDEVAALVAAGHIQVPIAARFPVQQVRAAVELQAGRHVHGKIVIDL
jgi:NADPH:quinone reductase-like Zn-dependent oxidoreductase